MNKFQFKKTLLDLYIALFAWKTYHAEVTRIRALKAPKSEMKKLEQKARNARNRILIRFRINELNKRWQNANPEKCKESRQEYYQSNRSAILAKNMEWKRNNPEKTRVTQRKANKKWNERNPGAMKACKKRYQRKLFAKRIAEGQAVANASMITAAELRRQFEKN
ncbi:MAG: hypothetical protein LBG89_00590 [Rickettsiales bacterium]|jgi:hypothetical protein|nr:hypothetical protein [Rickettsiales bacterium]